MPSVYNKNTGVHTVYDTMCTVLKKPVGLVDLIPGVELDMPLKFITGQTRQVSDKHLPILAN